MRSCQVPSSHTLIDSYRLFTYCSPPDGGDRMDVEAEIRDLKRRVGELEGSFSFPSGQLRDVHRSVLNFQEETNGRFDRVDARFDRVDPRFDGVDARLDGVDARLDRVEEEVRFVKDDVRQLREDLPGIVGGAVREAMREGR